eukprot:CAMPEP_0114554354 /NCGR_PEP_ID=MMETSP0114-20121206/8169_1 /TAXON_ID=31324 /ORGANISM="Goniomonas sp, Strain m" /LENGTH=321 /DNA_ID=CAMNT_0001739403 /DNA_START=20 /DNA_END=985 /DNA_ORIENTATION=-
MSKPHALPTKVTVHPLVLLSTVDHYNRVAKDTRKRVVGVLLGEVFKGTADVLSSFAVPFEEDERDPSIWYLDHNFLENMAAMFRKVNARENIVGWYSTGPKIKPSDLAINELFKKYTRNPIFLIVHTKDEGGIPTESYVAVEEVKDDGTPTQRTFQHLPSEIGALEAEEIGVEHLLRDIKDTTVSTLANQVSAKLASLKGLKTRLEEIQQYLNDVTSGKLPVNHEVTQLLQEIFNLLPNLQVEELVRAFAVKTNDMMLVVYLSSCIRSVVALHNLINNKLALKEAEGGKKEEKKKDAEKADGDKKDEEKDGKKPAADAKKK